MGEVVSVVAVDGQFKVTLADGSHYQTRKVLLATGIKDQLPAIEGLAPLWGKSAFHCAYCDGWEQHNQPVAIAANGETAMHGTSEVRNLSTHRLKIRPIPRRGDTLPG